jgi:hypothetical protein
VDGSTLRASGRGRDRFAGGPLRFRWSIETQLDGESASGTLTVHGRWRGHGCNKDPRRQIELRVERAPSGALVTPPAGVFLGLTDQPIGDRLRGSVVARVAADGKRVSARWSVSASCRGGEALRLTNYSPPAPVGTDGRFVKRERFPVRFSNARARYRVVFAGRFRADGVAGTLRLRAVIRKPRGRKVIGRCDSGTRRWTALGALRGT